MKLKLLKLAHMVLKLAEVKSDKGTLIYEGELGEGVEVFIEEDGEITPAADGEYTLEDGKVIVVVEWKVAEIKEETPAEEPVEVEAEEETPAEEPVETEIEDLKAEIESLKAEIVAKDEEIAALKAEIETLKTTVEEQETKLNMSAETPLTKRNNNITNKALKYFV